MKRTFLTNTYPIAWTVVLWAAGCMVVWGQDGTTDTFEAAARAESKRELASNRSPKAAEASALETTVDSADAPVIHLPSTPQKIKEPEEDEQDTLSERENRQWLLTGVMKLEGSYEESLTEEERKALKERRERLGAPPRFIDHMAEVKQKQREAAELLEMDAEQQFLSAADETTDALSTFALSRSEPLSLFAGPRAQTRVEYARPIEASLGSNISAYSRETLMGYEGTEVKANPYLAEVNSGGATNRFISEMESRPAPLLEATKKPSQPAVEFIPDPAAESASAEVRRYRPEKDLDEKYFKDLRRF